MPRRRVPLLQRKIGKTSPKQKFYIFCEGKNTEPSYFKSIEMIFSQTLIEISTRGGIGDPVKIAEAAEARSIELMRGNRRKGGADSYEKNDQVWAVFDRDEHTL